MKCSLGRDIGQGKRRVLKRKNWQHFGSGGREGTVEKRLQTFHPK